MFRSCLVTLLAPALAAQQFAPAGGRGPDQVLPPGIFNTLGFADIDVDGDQDLCAGSVGGEFDLWRRSGPRSWTRHPQFPFPITAAAWADFDRDSDPDLLVASTGVGTVPWGILRNDGTGLVWTGQQPATVTGGATSLVVGDLNGDSWPDAVLGAQTGCQILWNNGAGALSAAPGWLTQGTSYPELFDRDGDGDLDLVVVSAHGLYLFDNLGGTLQSAPGILPNTSADRVSAADFDLDGRVDLAIHRDTMVYIAWNGANGWSLTTGVLQDGLPLRGMLVTDLDADGQPDIVVRLRNGIDWLRSGPSRTFARQVGLRRGGPSNTGTSFTTAMATADVTGRGTNDVVCVWYDGSSDVLYGGSPRPFADPATGREVAEFLTEFYSAPEVGDLDGDGDEDLVIPNPPQVVLRDDRGRLRGTPIPGARLLHQAAMLADLDQDGDLDLILGQTALLSPAQHFDNDGSGNFTFVRDIVLPFHQQPFRFGDVDGDGDVDLLAPSGGQIVVFDNQGAAGFVHIGYLPGVQATTGDTLVVDDLNGDGKLDLMVGSDPAGLPIWFGNGAGSFSQGTSIPATLDYPYQVAAVDVDGDGDRDLVVSETGQRALFRNDSSGNFSRVLGAFPPGAPGVIHADIDGDGDQDFFTNGYPASLVLNDGSGVFTDATTILWSTNFAYNWRFIDFDGDGDQDLLVRLGQVWHRIPNRLRDAVSMQAPRPGGALVVRFEAALQSPGPGTFMLPMVAFTPGPAVTVPGLGGTFQLPVQASTLVAVLSAPSNVASWTLPIPLTPNLVGLGICVQGLVVGPNVPQGYTNLVCERILP